MRGCTHLPVRSPVHPAGCARHLHLGAAFVVVRADGAVDGQPVFGFAPYGVTNPLDVP